MEMRLLPIEDGFSVLVPEGSDIRRRLPVRDRYAHKGDFGRDLLLCGSVGYTGAAALAARAALRCGAGLVTVLTPKEAYPVVAVKLDEAMVRPVACDGEGRVSREAEGEILEQLAKADCGPGQERGARRADPRGDPSRPMPCRFGRRRSKRICRAYRYTARGKGSGDPHAP